MRSRTFPGRFPPFVRLCRRCTGFTLIEVLVALAVFLVAASGLIYAVFNTQLGLLALQRETEQIDDLRFVRNLVLQEPDLRVFERGGEVTTLDRGVARWEAEVEETSLLHLFRVMLQIEFEPPLGETERFISEETLYVLRPTWTEPADATELLQDAREKIEANRRKGGWGR